MEIKESNYASTDKLVSDLLEKHIVAVGKAIPAYEKKEIAFTAYDDNGAVLGAVVGEIVWNHLHVSLLGIDQTMQKQGVGQKLLQHIEEYAKQFGARMVILETMSWQAPKFYQKNGYQIFGTVENHPIEGECKYYLSKVLPS
ncbi:GNAT family N-acetyltransferase [Carnobacterium divergens]|uniref:N-acetyltransferase domain-containing protein n=2 Tax=Carnobacterium divergens TaxID=2748 RepID=A0A0R2HP27_CARDV|nr:GNAT family N-acetyltransferase [Carnobacterium divergens]AOA00231.1 hypothetical protein BFC22_08960 [Carnobacterium divergens]KRN54609.1 hypothetical protein IV74_GL002193 [Carnobacterium divergens DSM 20623]MDO0874094.1 GNAT family N-acetyltransferase [Carnobacterium divergens]MDT1958014.1 GNAT family N-acetyltransferase [Carnobacterium divergens]MDT1974017.1 GNAT family N-acetyltransferase [Carnobacterium divergens]